MPTIADHHRHATTPRRLAELQTPREKAVGWLKFAVFWLSFPVLFLLALTLGTIDLQLQRGAEYTAEETRATAYVKECTEYGPISHAGFGYHWSCSVDYGRVGSSWKPESRETLSSQFTPADIGGTFAVQKIGKNLYRYHETGEFTWARVWVLIPVAPIALMMVRLTKRRWPLWAFPGLARQIKADPEVGHEFVVKLLREGRLEARPHADEVTTTEIDLRRGYRMHLTGAGITAKRKGQLVWSLRRRQIEQVRLTALHAPADYGEPAAVVMDLFTVPREFGQREPGLKEHWGAMGIEGGCRFEYGWSSEQRS